MDVLTPCGPTGLAALGVLSCRHRVALGSEVVHVPASAPLRRLAPVQGFSSGWQSCAPENTICWPDQGPSF